MSKNTRTLLRGGTVVTATDVVLADIAVLGEKVLGVLAPGSELSESFARGAEIVVDASGSTRFHMSIPHRALRKRR